MKQTKMKQWKQTKIKSNIKKEEKQKTFLLEN